MGFKMSDFSLPENHRHGSREVLIVKVRTDHVFDLAKARRRESNVFRKYEGRK